MIHNKLTVKVVATERKYARPLAKLQPIIFPTLTPDEHFTEAHYLHHIQIFPEGQLTALVHIHDKWVVAGSTVTFRATWDFASTPHTYETVIGGGWLPYHNPKGEWLYGGDLSVSPEFHGKGIGGALYKARKEVARKLNLRGEVAGGMLPGYHRYRSQMSVERYVEKVVIGEIFDPTLSVQVKNGFQVKGILYDHITDPRSNNCAALIVRPNPHYNTSRV